MWLSNGPRAAVRGAALIVTQAAVIGLTANALNPDRLPWVRVPAQESRRTATATEVLKSPVEEPPVRATTPRVPPNTPPAPAVTTSKPATPITGPPVPIPPHPAKAAPKAIRTERPAKPAPPVATSAPPRALPGLTATKPAPTATKDPAPAPKPAEALFTTLADTKALFDRGEVVFVDARHPEDYASQHIAGAVSLFVDEIEQHYAGAVGSLPKDRTIVTYCSDAQCEAAVKLADALVAKGHSRVFILLDGLPGWAGAGYPTREGKLP